MSMILTTTMSERTHREHDLGNNGASDYNLDRHDVGAEAHDHDLDKQRHQSRVKFYEIEGCGKQRSHARSVRRTTAREIGGRRTGL